MKLYLVRHGETEENKNTMLMGRTDGVLSALGEVEARKTGEALKDKNIEVIYSSPMGRAFHTAEFMNESLGVDIIKEPLVVERDFGKFTNSHVHNVDFDLLDMETKENKEAGVEFMSEVFDRLRKFIAKMEEFHSVDESVAVVSHSGPVRVFLAIMLGKTHNEILAEYKIKNCSISVFELMKGEKPKVISINDIEHLR